MNNEFLRPRENRCKWFNKFVNVWKRLYIVRGDKRKISHKNNLVNRYRFRQQKTTQECMKDEKIQCMSESVQVSPGWRMIRFNLQMNRFSEVREFCETIQTEMNRFKCDTIQEVVNRFFCSQRFRWIDSVYDKRLNMLQKDQWQIFTSES